MLHVCQSPTSTMTRNNLPNSAALPGCRCRPATPVPSCFANNPAGPTNKKLRVHLPLVTPGGGLSRVRVGSRTKEARAGQALIFDDSFEHEAWNDDDDDDDDGDSNSASVSILHKKRGARLASSSRHVEEGTPAEEREEGTAAAARGGGIAGPRVTLIADIWHPDLTWG